MRISDNKEIFWQYGGSNAVGADKKTIQVNGTASVYNHAEVGDEILILQGVNGGCRRRITAIANPGTVTETWTLDSDMNANIESGTKFNIFPFTYVDKKSYTDYTKNYFYFDLSKHELIGQGFIELTFKHSYSPISITNIVLKPSEIADSPNN